MGVSISEFRGEYYFLSNFYSAPVTYNGMCFENNEAAFQAAKCPERMTEFCRLNPSEAKRLGRRVKLRGDWEARQLIGGLAANTGSYAGYLGA